jgi:hypothetical protein
MRSASLFGGVLVASVLGVAACGGGGSSGGRAAQSEGASAAVRHEVASIRAALVRRVRVFSPCVQEHGVRDFPEPNSQGVLPSSRLRALHRSNEAARESVALGDCAHLLQHHNEAPLIGVSLHR